MPQSPAAGDRGELPGKPQIARYWEPHGDSRVRCNLCHQRCVIAAGGRGLCGVRENRDGTLYSLVYGKAVARAVDPIEKKPLHHFLPGSYSFSVATVGCNFHCRHCQNCEISMVAGEEWRDLGEDLSPSQIVALAEAAQCASVSYTYTEPTIFFEYAADTARLAHAKGLRNVFVTNGYITPEPLREIAPFLDAANIDLKSFSDSTYRELCGARLAPVLDTIRRYYELGIWMELTTLIIPGWNDSEDEFRRIARFIADLGPDIPWHVSRFFPSHRLPDVPPTPVQTLLRAATLGAEAGLRYVYTGNIAHDAGQATSCPECRRKLIERGRHGLYMNALAQGTCPSCGTAIPGVWA
jgi:pyruvate formate lyase activating enzyme